MELGARQQVKIWKTCHSLLYSWIIAEFDVNDNQPTRDEVSPASKSRYDWIDIKAM